MIKVNIIGKNDKIEILGHAMYDDFGKDIVCAAVSSIVITTVNGIERIDKEAISYNENPFSLKVLKQNDVVNTLIENMISLLKELERDYPDNIKVL